MEYVIETTAFFSGGQKLYHLNEGTKTFPSTTPEGIKHLATLKEIEEFILDQGKDGDIIIHVTGETQTIEEFRKGALAFKKLVENHEVCVSSV